MDPSNDPEDFSGKAFEYLDCIGFCCRCQKRDGYATGHSPLDFWRVSTSGFYFRYAYQHIIVSLKRQEDGTFKDEDLANLLKNACVTSS